MEIRRLTERDADALWQLRLAALQTDPQAFGESADEHARKTPDTYAERLRSGASDNFILGAFDGSDLVGMIGFYRDPRLNRRHKGWIWGVFVSPAHRGKGIARALLADLLQKARNLPDLSCILLTVATTQESARRLYLSAGFRSFGIEPRALRVNDRFFDEEHMILEI